VLLFVALQASAQGVIISGVDPAHKLVISIPYVTEAKSDDVVVSQVRTALLILLRADVAYVDPPER
jgi:hypothetical protein